MAKWIWTNPDAQPDEYADFAATLIARKDAKYTLRVSADSNYALYISGALCEFGQYADYPSDKFTDVIDISRHLNDGENKLCFMVWYYGVTTQTYSVGRAGLYFEILEDGKSISESDETILCRPSKGYVPHEAQYITGQLGFSYHYDARLADDFIQTGTAADLTPGIVQEGISLSFTERPVKKLVLEPRSDGVICMTGKFRYENPTERPELNMQHAYMAFRNYGVLNRNLSTFDEPFIIGDKDAVAEKQDCAGGVYIIIDLIKETAGFLDFDIELPFDCRIDIGYGEHLTDGRCRTEIDGRNFSAAYDGVKGRNIFLNPFRRFGCRYIQFFIHAPCASIRYAGIRPVVYPVTPGKFKSGNILRDTIYNVAQNTLIQCMHEQYEDCPWREQALYCMDSRNQMLCGYYAFGEYAMPRASLALMLNGINDKGLLSICYPSDSKLFIPSFTLVYFIQMYEYIVYSGDTTLAQSSYDTLKQIMERFLIRKDKRGLIESFHEEGCWNFYEWTPGLEGCIGKGEKGIFEAALNAFASLALQNLSKISDALEQKEDAERCRAEAKLLNNAIARYFYNETTKLFENRDKHNGNCYNILTNSLCTLCGAADGLEKKNILNILASNGKDNLGYTVVSDTLSMNTFRFDALIREDKEKYREIILNEIDNTYLHMLREGATAFWETIDGAGAFERAGSLCHGWSAMPIFYYETLCTAGAERN